jgi:uncharacterized delta-60 repeat protein
MMKRCGFPKLAAAAAAAFILGACQPPAPEAHLATGSLDTSFDPGTGADSQVWTLALQGDGKVLIGGWFTNYNGVSQRYLARLTASGALDPAFVTGNGPGYLVTCIAVQPDGKILIGGAFSDYDGTGRKGIARLTSNGALDATFDPGVGPNGTPYALCVLPDGKIMVGGDFSTWNGVSYGGVARLNTDGTLDGTLIEGGGANSMVFSIIRLKSGKILLGGNFWEYNGDFHAYLVRINDDGTADTAFDSGYGAYYVRDTAECPDGKIIVVGSYTQYDHVGRNNICRINADGTLDAAFDPGSGTDGPIYDAVLQDNGRILIGGNFSTYNDTPRSHLARVNPDGGLDTTFDPGTGVNNEINRLALQPNGKILIGGQFTDYAGTGRNRVARVE